MDLYYEIVFYSFLLPPLMAAILFLSGVYSSRLNILVLLSIASVVCETAFLTLARNSIHTTFLEHLSLSIDVILFVSFFQSNVITPHMKRISFVLMDMLVLVCISEALIGGIHNYPVFAKSFVHIVVICMVLYYYYEVFRFEHIENLPGDSGFWINSVYLLFFSGTFAYNVFLEEQMNGNFSFKIDLVNWILLIVFNLVFTLAIWLGRTRKISI